jgi:hypothetical protein
MQSRDETTQPEDVAVLGGERFVLSADDLTHPLNGLSCVHSFQNRLSGLHGQILSKAKQTMTSIFALENMPRLVV